MIKMNIFNLLYKYSPLNFYNVANGRTVIKSIHNPSSGYEFDKEFNADDISLIWHEIKLHRRVSTIFIFILFIAALYEFVFPHFSLFVNNTWFVNALLILSVLWLVCLFSNILCKYIFEKRLSNIFGGYKIVKFENDDKTDTKYYSIFKFELLKAMILVIFGIAFIVVLAFLVSPFNMAQTLVKNERYTEAIKLTTLGADIFPIAQEWYALRGYSKFKTGDYPGSIADYDKAYNLSADAFNIMNFDNKIFVKYHIGDYDGALDDFDREIAKASNDNERNQFLWDKAQFLYNIKKYEEALEIYDTLILNADNDRVFLLKDRLYLERAEVNKKLGNTEQAQSDLFNAGVNEYETGDNPIPKPVLIFDTETFG